MIKFIISRFQLSDICKKHLNWTYMLLHTLFDSTCRTSIKIMNQNQISKLQIFRLKHFNPQHNKTTFLYIFDWTAKSRIRFTIPKGCCMQDMIFLSQGSFVALHREFPEVPLEISWCILWVYPICNLCLMSLFGDEIVYTNWGISD